MHRINVDHNHRSWCDFPQLGWDADAIYVACNMIGFRMAEGGQHVHLLTIDKASVLDGDPAPAIN
jgi:hypothetical protein